MRDEHVKKLLDEAPLSSLGRAELAAVRAHAEVCEFLLGFAAGALAPAAYRARQRDGGGRGGR